MFVIINKLEKCRCECNELIDKGIYDKGFIWSPSNWECECDQSCDTAYLDYEICKCRKKEIVDELIEKCNENIEGEIVYNETVNDYESICGSCTVYIVLLVIAFLKVIGISSAFSYFQWYSKKSNTGVIKINPSIEMVIY